MQILKLVGSRNQSNKRRSGALGYTEVEFHQFRDAAQHPVPAH